MKQRALLDVDPSARRAFDLYETPQWMTRALLRRCHVHDVLEPCAGKGAIANVLRREGVKVVTNDLAQPADFALDMTTKAAWELLTYPFTRNMLMWGVTNLPFNVADGIVPLAVESLPSFATILRLTWLEPTAARAPFLKAHPPTRLIVLPRHDFRGNGQTDSVTSAWFIWNKGSGHYQGIEVVTKEERDELIATEKAR